MTSSTTQRGLFAWQPLLLLLLLAKPGTEDGIVQCRSHCPGIHVFVHTHTHTSTHTHTHTHRETRTLTLKDTCIVSTEETERLPRRYESPEPLLNVWV